MLIGYARVSTADQNTDAQVAALKAAGCTKIFTEKASGADRNRPQLTKALAYARKGDIIVAWKLDRLARSLSHLLEISAALQARGIDLKVTTQPIDTSTAMGKVLFAMMGAFAEMERDLIRERTVVGMQAAKARGIHCGRPPKAEPEPQPVPFGEA